MASQIMKYLLWLLLVVITGCYLFYFNLKPVKVTLGPGFTREAPLAIILVTAFFLGTVAVGAIAIYLGAKHSFQEWREKNKRKRMANHTELLLTGNEFLALNNFGSAKANFEKIVNQDPKNLLAWVALANVEENQGKTRESLQTLEKARLHGKSSFALLFKIAEINESLGNYTAAYDNLTLVLDTHPDNLIALQKIAECCRKLKRYDEAISFVSQLTRKGSNKDQQAYFEQLAQLKLQEARTKHGNNPEEFKSSLDDILKKHRDFAPALNALAELEQAQSNLAAAAKLWTKAYQVTLDASYLQSLSSMWLSEDNPSGAISSVTSALTGRKSQGLDHTTGKMFLINLLLTLENIEEAKAEISRLSPVEDLPEKVKTELKLAKAHILTREGQLASANSLLAELIEEEKGLIGCCTLKRLKLNGKGTSRDSDTPRARLDPPSPRLSTP